MPSHESASRYPEILADVATIVAAKLAELGTPEEQADEIGKSAAEVLRRNFAGQSIYFPVGTSYENRERDEEIYKSFSGGESMPVLATKHKLSAERIRQIVNEQKALAQPGLF